MPSRHPLVPLTDLVEGEGLHVEVEGHHIALFRKGETVHAVGDTCPHMGAPLSDGYVDDTSVVCPWHGWVFDLRTGDSPFDDEAGVPVYRAVVEDGMVVVEIEAPAAPAEDRNVVDRSGR